MTTPLTLVPLRAGKTRLADIFDAPTRDSLRAAMLADVVSALRGANLDTIIVACADDESEALATALDLAVHRDPPATTSLDDAIRAAVADLAGDDTEVLVVTADLPAITTNDIRALLYAPGKVVIAPTDDGGTGALLRRPHDVIPTAYGAESAALHAARSLDVGLMPSVLHLPGFRIDVDTEFDLDALESVTTLGENTRTWLSERPPA